MVTLKDNKLTLRDGQTIEINKAPFTEIVYEEEYVKEAVFEFSKYQLYYIGHKIHCEDCENFIEFFYCIDLYSKQNKYYCKDCLSKKIFGDFEK